MREPTGAHSLLTTLRAAGVGTVLTCPGTTEIALLQATPDVPEVRFVVALHESVAVAAADGMAREERRPVVAYLHTNVGLGNGLAHLYAAQLGASPVVVLNGLKPRGILNRRAFTHTQGILETARSFTKWARISWTPETLASDLREALRTAMAPPRGPVYLGIPQDLLESPLAPEEAGGNAPLPIAAPRSQPPPEDLARAAELLRRAERPLIVAGSEVGHAGAEPLAETLATRLDAPLAWDSRRLLERPGCDGGHPNFIGTFDVRRSAEREASLVLAVGSRGSIEFSERDRAANELDGTRVQIAPTASDVDECAGRDLALVGDCEPTLEGLVEALGSPSGEPHEPRQAFLAAARAEYGRQAAELAALPASPPGAGDAPGPAAHILAEIARQPRDHLFVCDGVTAQVGLFGALAAGGHRNLRATSSGSLGWGMGAAVGIAMSGAHRRVVCVTGDGSAHFGIQSLWSAARLGLPITFVIIDNQSYAAVKSALEAAERRPVGLAEFPGTDIAGADIAAIAQGYGVPARQVRSSGDLAEALEHAAKTEGPALLDALVTPGERAGMSVNP